VEQSLKVRIELKVGIVRWIWIAKAYATVLVLKLNPEPLPSSIFKSNPCG